MKNAKYFPFERNNYFYGKLLSVDDFRMEQQYGNDKRRMLNRFLYGTGVVTGMNVVAVDDTTVLVESGLALDYSGREIVIDEPVARRLQTLEGFGDYEEDRNTGYLYLCVAYEEEEVQAVHSISHSDQKDNTSFNKIREGYRLYLTRNEPGQDGLNYRSFYETTEQIYWDKGIRVRQSMPKFVRSGDSATLQIEVENMGQQEHFAFSYELELQCLTYEGRPHLTVSFDELLFEKAGRYLFSYELDALSIKDTQACISLVPESFKLRIGQNQTVEKAEGQTILQICSQSVREEVRRDFYENGMGQILKGGSQSLYLAKITLLRAGDVVVINEIEKMPFKQYAAVSVLEDVLFRMSELQESKDGITKTGGSETGTNSHRDAYGINIAEGVEEIELGMGSGKGKKLFSREISHGLGMGRTTVILSIEGISAQEEYFGTGGIFQSHQPRVELAARTDFKRGVFVIGVRVLSAASQDRIRVHWTAIRDRKELVEEKKEPRIFIRPNVLNLNVRESYFLEAVCSNMNETEVVWQVKGHGGTIDESGMYTAPNTAGVYEVMAVSAAYPEVKASIFVIVREKSENK
ncbi:MAG: hypothetical protein J1E83_14060 [Lachnospiraceae bacterium]|nr:hypothetical protein [Lachnospiraceae bacterium]